jgi:hypothetical protein
MSPKSKYNRRNISQNKPESTNPAEARTAGAAQTVNTGSLKSTNTAAANAKAILDMTSSETFLSDLKWIGIVTAIILVFLIVAYFLFH